MNEQRMQSAKREDTNGHFDLEVLFTLLFTEKRLIIYTVSIIFAVTMVITILSPQKYEATAKLLAEPTRQENPLGIQAATIGDKRLFLETQKELIISKSVLRETLAKIENAAPADLRQSDIRGLEQQVAIRSRAEIGKPLFSGDGIGESNTLFVSVTDTNEDRAVRAADALVDTYLAKISELSRNQAQAATKALKETVDKTNGSVKEAHAKLVAFEKETGSLLPELMNIDKPNIRIFSELEDLRKEYESHEVILAEHRARLAFLEKASDLAPSDAESALASIIVEDTPVLRQMLARRAELLGQLAEMLPLYNENSREIRIIREKIDLMNEQTVEEIGRMHSAEKETVMILEQAQQARTDALERYDTKLANLSALNSVYAELKREYEARSEALERQIQLLAEAEALSARDSVQGVNVAIIDTPASNVNPVSKGILRNAVLSLLLGLVFGILAVILTYMARPYILHPRQLDEMLDIPIIAILSSEEKV